MSRLLPLLMGGVLLTLGCKDKESQSDPPQVATQTAPAKATPPVAAPQKATPPKAEKTGLPASDRLFTVTIEGVGPILLGASKNSLWARSLTKDAQLWRVQGEGVPQKVIAATLGAKPLIYVAWGMGRGYLKSPLSVMTIDPQTGQTKTIWQHNGPRNEAAHLLVADADNDGTKELVLGYYSSKYMVRTAIIERDGQVIETPDVRMASSRVFADLNGDQKLDEAVGRVYGDARGLVGDLKVNLGAGPKQVPTDNGIKALWAGKAGLDSTPSLYVSDGWVANYGKAAKAQIKRLKMIDGVFKSSVIGRSADEFTFFSLQVVRFTPQGAPVVIGHGNKHVTLFKEIKPDTWSAKVVATFEPVLNTLVAPHKEGWAVYVPSSPKTKVIPFTP